MLDENIVEYDGKTYIKCKMCGHHFWEKWMKAHITGCGILW